MDSKVLGPQRSFKVNCRKCGARIVFRGLPQTAEFEAIEWFYATARDRHGPVSIQMLRELYQAQTIDLDTLVWRQGQDAWRPVASYPTVMAALTRGEDEPDPHLAISPVPGPVVLPEVDELLAGLSPQSPSPTADIYARNEQSVLFNLDDLQAAEERVGSDQTGSQEPRMIGSFSRTETSGLLDIFSASAEPKPSPSRPFHERLISENSLAEAEWDLSPAVKGSRWRHRRTLSLGIGAGVLMLLALTFSLWTMSPSEDLPHGTHGTSRGDLDSALKPEKLLPDTRLQANRGDASTSGLAPLLRADGTVTSRSDVVGAEVSQPTSADGPVVLHHERMGDRDANQPPLSAKPEAEPQKPTPPPVPKRLSSASFKQTMGQRHEAFLTCDPSLKERLSEGAFMRANITILSDGAVADIKVIATGGIQRSVVSCIITAIRDTRFKAFRRAKQRHRYTLSL